MRARSSTASRCDEFRDRYRAAFGRIAVTRLRPGALACGGGAAGRNAAASRRRGAETPVWDQTLSRVAPSVVTIEIDQARAFDTEWNQSSQATGFVVDAERGLILTNRHVVTPGPGGRDRRVPESRGSGAAAPSTAIRCTTSASIATTRRSCASSSRRRCRSIRPGARSASRSAWSATMPGSSCRSLPARLRGSTGRRPNTASASTTTSTRSTSRRPRAPPAVPRDRRSSTSRAAWSA